MNRLISKFDNKLTNLDGLRWFPFIGKNYDINKTRILIIGESHYYNISLQNENIENKMFTRWVTDELGLCNRNYPDKSNFFKVINRHFARNNIDEFWNKISFYNFIQRPMMKDDEKKYIERPSTQDFDNGWQVFFKLIDMIKPDYCLFLGNSSADRFNRNVAKFDLAHDKIQWISKINGAYLKHGRVILNNDSTVELLFIKHPSSRFTATKWIEALKLKDNRLINSLINSI